MTSSLGTFLEMMNQFLQELSAVFPSEKKLKSYHLKFDTLRSSNPQKVLELFMDSISPVSELIVNRDETLFLENKCDFLNDIDIKKLWGSGISENTKNAIWSHLNTLFILGSTIQNIPSDLMKHIEDVAKQCAESMDSSKGTMNPEQMMNAMRNMLR